jgi:hypothetical protein
MYNKDMHEDRGCYGNNNNNNNNKSHLNFLVTPIRVASSRKVG